MWLIREGNLVFSPTFFLNFVFHFETNSEKDIHLITPLFKVPEVFVRFYPNLNIATSCFSCSPPDLNSVVTDFMFCMHVK